MENERKEIAKVEEPRTMSTSIIIMSIFLVIMVLLTIFTYSVNLHMIPDSGAASASDAIFSDLSVESASASSDNSAGRAFGMAIAIVLLIPLVLLMSGAGVVISGVCLGFSIHARKSTSKAIRIISYVYDGLFALFLAASIARIALLGVL